MAKLPAIALLACIVTATIANAQSVPVVNRAVVAASAVAKQLDAAVGNLNQMSHGLTSTEQDCATHIVAAAQEFEIALIETLTDGRMLTEMKAAEDLNTVQFYFGGAARNAVSMGGNDLNFINQCLVAIRAPAALAEATKIRDAIIEACDMFKPFAAPSSK